MTFADHLVPTLSPFVGATAAVMATTTLHTGTLVLNNDFRHPVDVARETQALVDRQRRLGISYWTVFDELPGRASALPDLAKVIALLRN